MKRRRASSRDLGRGPSLPPSASPVAGRGVCLRYIVARPVLFPKPISPTPIRRRDRIRLIRSWLLRITIVFFCANVNRSAAEHNSVSSILSRADDFVNVRIDLCLDRTRITTRSNAAPPRESFHFLFTHGERRAIPAHAATPRPRIDGWLQPRVPHSPEQFFRPSDAKSTFA